MILLFLWNWVSLENVKLLPIPATEFIYAYKHDVCSPGLGART